MAWATQGVAPLVAPSIQFSVSCAILTPQMQAWVVTKIALTPGASQRQTIVHANSLTDALVFGATALGTTTAMVTAQMYNGPTLGALARP